MFEIFPEIGSLDVNQIQPDRNHGESTSLITLEKPTRQSDHGSKIPSELMKQIISLFPNKLTILLPKVLICDFLNPPWEKIDIQTPGDLITLTAAAATG
ncbi:uncharacterized protein LOC123918253 isoform X2 [Trifolium pratense]|uniref:uncharacterized protein LOC123918253 isoform X2 n=1 Tax=Trifolium pratense TaxID=57577 RepID=UPI001E69223B|nr:uncharacterized protein LOC123918253 isoform X2 [Trifolium pratense]XP_045826214.1 uncharacterized protein LOC123918253 isoform X2 [Trifolium pratense]